MGEEKLFTEKKPDVQQVKNFAVRCVDPGPNPTHEEGEEAVDEQLEGDILPNSEDS